MPRFFAKLTAFNDNQQGVRCSGYYRAASRQSDEELLARFRDEATAGLTNSGATPPIPTRISVEYHFELADLPALPSGDGRSLRSWQVEAAYVCHDLKMGGTARGVFAWPEEPSGDALQRMASVVLDDEFAELVYGPDFAGYADLREITAQETEALPDYRPG